ncbi:MAG: AAA family ATPase, partial [Endomicrobium sp.]|nr:AAA family ATPase [Endomicrobium sp.]
TLDKVASYKNKTSLETDKKVNLIYGLNGTGKTIIANYLDSPNNTDYLDNPSNTDFFWWLY